MRKPENGETFKIAAVNIVNAPLPLQVPVGLLSNALRVGDIVTLQGMGWQRDIGVAFRIPETQLFEIVCPDLMPEGAD